MQAIFDKLVKHWHLKALYVKGFVDGKPMSKILVDGGASVNLMPYTTFCKLGKEPECNTLKFASLEIELK